MGEDVRIAGDRDVRGTIDSAGAGAAVVACPPHPRMGGSRSDSRLRAVGDALAERGVACLRIDYGPWDEGYGERRDATGALAFARERYDPVGLFGYSFGGAVALLAAADAGAAAVSTLSPAPSLAADLDAVAALDGVDAPVQVVYGERDSTVDSEPVAERVRERGGTVETLPADHFFVGQAATVGDSAGGFLADRLR